MKKRTHLTGTTARVTKYQLTVFLQHLPSRQSIFGNVILVPNLNSPPFSFHFDLHLHPKLQSPPPPGGETGDVEEGGNPDEEPEALLQVEEEQETRRSSGSQWDGRLLQERAGGHLWTFFREHG